MVGPPFSNIDVIDNYDFIVTSMFPKYWCGQAPLALPPTTSLLHMTMRRPVSANDQKLGLGQLGAKSKFKLVSLTGKAVTAEKRTHFSLYILSYATFTNRLVTIAPPPWNGMVYTLLHLQLLDDKKSKKKTMYR